MSNGQSKEVAVLRGHRALISRAGFSDDGKRLITASSAKTARVWDATWREEAMRRVNRASDHLFFDVDRRWLSTAGRRAFNRTGSLLAVSGTAGAVVWNIPLQRIVAKPQHGRPVTSVSFSKDGEWFATGTADGTVTVWSTGTWSSEVVLSHETPSDLVVFSPIRNGLPRWVSNARLSGTVRVDVTLLSAVQRPGPGASANLGERGSVSPFAIQGTHPSGGWASRICRNGSVLRAVGPAAFSPDAARVLTWELNKASVRDSDSWKSLVEIANPSANISYAAFSPNGQCVVTAGEDRRGTEAPNTPPGCGMRGPGRSCSSCAATRIY